MARTRGKKQAWAVGLVVLALGFVASPILYREFKLRHSLMMTLHALSGSEVTPSAEWFDDFRNFAERSGRHRTIQLLKDYAEDDADLRLIAVLALSSLLPSDECHKYAHNVLSEEEFFWFVRVVVKRAFRQRYR